MPSRKKSLFVLLGNHLYHPDFLKGHEQDLFFMAENRDFCHSNTFHKHKLTFYLSAMRHYARELKYHDLNLVYFGMDETKGLAYEDILKKVMKESSLKNLTMFEIEGKEQENKIITFCKDNDFKLEFVPSPGFLVSRQEFKSYVHGKSKPDFRRFYEDQRSRHKILVEKDGSPFGGRFIIDEEEKLKWSPKKNTPKFPASVHDEIDAAVIQLVRQEFSENPGMARAFWYPTSREGALSTFKDFCEHRLPEFGVYQSAICPNEDFLFHSVLAPLLNVGLLTPKQVLDGVIQHAAHHPVSLNSLEAFVRQILGYREYIHGIYQNFGEQQQSSNTLNHERLLHQNWRDGKTGIPLLDDSIQKASRLAYSHGTERSMVLKNMMNLAEINPQEIHRWFAEMHIDSAEWALVPNIYDQSPESAMVWNSKDWLKVSNYERGEWCEEVDGLYWRFVEKNKKALSKTAASAGLIAELEKLPSDRRQTLERAADNFLARNTVYP